MTNEQDPDATIRALEAQLEAARAQARIEAMEAELAALKAQSAGEADAAAEAAAAQAADAAATEAAAAARQAAQQAAEAATEAAAKEASELAASQARAAAMEAELAQLQAAQQTPTPAPGAAPAAPLVATPAAQQAAAPVAAVAPLAPKGRKGLVAALVVLLLAFVATLGGTYLAIRGDIRAPWAAAAPAPSDVVLIAAGDLGPAPAVADAVPSIAFEELSKAATNPAPDPLATLSVASVAGDAAEIYAVSHASCSYLSLDPEKDVDATAAFIAALNSDETLGLGRALTTDDFAGFARNLAFGHLLADTRVTYNGYSAGANFPMQAVLQRGTMVGFDRFGVPRVHCGSGVALTAPSAGFGEIRFSGQAWGDLDLNSLVTIAPAAKAQDSFTVVPLGPSNAQLSFTVSPRACAWSAPGACPEPSALADPERPEKVASAPAPAPAACSSWADGLTDADSVTARVVNASSSTQQLYMVESVGAGCGTRLDLAIGAGESTVLAYWPGTLVLFTNGQSADVTAEYSFGEQTLFVIQ